MLLLMQRLCLKAHLKSYRTVEMGVTHLPRVDGVSTGARPSVIIRNNQRSISIQERI